MKIRQLNKVIKIPGLVAPQLEPLEAIKKRFVPYTPSPESV